MSIRCKFGFHRMFQRDDETHIWGECERCGKRSGLVSRRAVRAYIEAQERAEAFEAEQARLLAEKPYYPVMWSDMT